MATLYKSPLSSPSENDDFSDNAEKKYIKKLQAKLKAMGHVGEGAGEVISFSVPGAMQAYYMVLSLKPARLIWLAVEDQREVNVRGLTAEDLRHEIIWHKRQVASGTFDY